MVFDIKRYKYKFKNNTNFYNANHKHSSVKECCAVDISNSNTSDYNVDSNIQLSITFE